MAHYKSQLRTLTHGLGAKISHHSPGQETCRDRTSSCTTFGMSTYPYNNKIKKYISSMLQAQAKSAKNNAGKDELSLLQVKPMAAEENTARYDIGSQERQKAEILLSFIRCIQ
jgi:hypothetical protein